MRLRRVRLYRRISSVLSGFAAQHFLQSLIGTLAFGHTSGVDAEQPHMQRRQSAGKLLPIATDTSQK